MELSPNVRFITLVTWFTVLSLSSNATLALAAPESAKIQEKEEAAIPKKPSAPPTLSKQPPPDVFTCQRRYMYKGRILPCDSHLHQDAEGLRGIFKDIPEAISELDRYQFVRQDIQNMAYIGSIGAFMAGVGFLFIKPTFPNQLLLARVVGYTGLAITAGSFAYSFHILQKNEDHLSKAIQIHNTTNPETPIELQVRAGFSF